MQALVSKLKESQSHLLFQGGAFVERTKEAGATFVGLTRAAGDDFVTTTREAGSGLGTSTRDAGAEVSDAVRSEAEQWRSFLAEQSSQLTRELRLLLLPGGLERQLLTQVREAIDAFGDRVGDRLDTLERPPALPAEPEAAPLRGYDKLTAKALVAKLAKLDLTEVEAVATYERDHKKRATVLRAADQRLAA